MKTLILASFLGIMGTAFGSLPTETIPLEQWIQAQKPRAILRLRDAISPNDAARGAVFASPSRVEPNYYYHWVRDAALVMREVYELRTEEPKTADRILREFVDFSRKNQLTVNPSGGPADLGLGEPKFHMDGSPYMESWGRPQNDGPALRAFLLSQYALDLWSEGERDYVTSKLYRAEIPATTLLKADLEYVAHHWQDASFDLWEESSGDHYYTRYTQYRALLEGAKLARFLGDPEAAEFYELQGEAIRQSLERFWSPEDRILRVTIRNNGGADYKSSGIDVAILLAAIQVGTEVGPFSIRDERVLQTVLAIENRFKGLYRINRVTETYEGLELGVAVGRYPEDRYDGYRTDRAGNPWFLATHAMAEFYYRLAQSALQEPEYFLSEKLRPLLSALTKRPMRAQQTTELLVQRLLERGDAFLRRAQYHSASAGHQSEQFHRDDGTLQGAVDLTWSYASFLSAVRARDELSRALNPSLRRRK